MNDFRSSVKKVMVVFLFCFIALISYIAYFQVFQAPDIAAKQGNRRLWAKRNEVVRGTIYDRNGVALTKGEKTGTLTQSREYINGDMYAHALGYENQKYGLTGLEASYDDELSTYSSVGLNIREFTKNFNFDKLKESFSKRGDSEVKIGNGIVTTLDPKIQKAAYDALGNRKGAVVAFNPKTGEILAMVSAPTYDPNNLDAVMTTANSASDTDKALINRAVGGLYPPGSTFKTITTTSALDNLQGITSEIFHDEGRLKLSETVSLPNVGGAPNGDINLKTAFMKSSNVVFGGLAIRLGNSKLKATAEDFGFNKNVPAVGVDISKSSFPTFDSNEIGMIAQCGIGQSEILATPIQMALVCSTIANGGVMMQPKLVNQVVDMNKNVVTTVGEKKYKTIMSAEHATTITDYMKGLASGLDILDGLDAAGKTGTAENSGGKDHSWFIGFAPADNPTIAVAVIVENSGFGAQFAGPVAVSVMKAGLNK